MFLLPRHNLSFILFLQVFDTVLSRNIRNLNNRRQTTIQVPRLTPGRLYNVRARSVLRGVRGTWSPPYEMQMSKNFQILDSASLFLKINILSGPAAVRSLRATRTTRDLIVLSIVPGAGTYTDFVVSFGKYDILTKNLVKFLLVWRCDCIS